MKKLMALGFALILVLTSFAQTEGFVMQGDSPIIEHTAATRNNRSYEYLEQYTDPGAVVYHDGQFHIFRNGFNGWPATVWIHYMVSEDGITWTQPSQEPVLQTADVPFAEVAALASSVIVEDDGTWVLYFYTANASGNSKRIGRATAPAPQGPWTVDPEPVLESSASWEILGVGAPQVLKTTEGYLMYYSGASSSGGQSIGLATSSDGITWEKSTANPILAPSESWEGNFIHQPRVVATENGYMMAYRAWNGREAGMALGLATSADGLEWTRTSTNPYISMADLPNYNSFWYTALAAVDGRLYLFLEITPQTDTTDIYLFTAELSEILP